MNMARTVGAKDKTPRKKNPVVSFEKQLEKWDAKEQKVNWQDLCQKLQNALAKAYVDCDLLEATVSEQKVIIRYLEGRTVV
jgi:Tfp pilus assembly PilM family ATPase